GCGGRGGQVTSAASVATGYARTCRSTVARVSPSTRACAADDGDEDLRVRTGDVLAQVRREPTGIQGEPEPDVGVEEEPHGVPDSSPSPSKYRWISGGRGASKSSAMTPRPA